MINMIYRWFGQLAIKKKLVVSHMISIAAAVLLVAVAMSFYEYQFLRSDVLKAARTNAAIVSDMIAVPAAFSDTKTANEALSLLKSLDEVQAVAMVLPDKTILASYERKGYYLTEADIEVTDKLFTLNEFVVAEPVMLQQTRVGTLILKAGLHKFYIRTISYFLTVLFSAILGVLVSYWLVVYLTKTVTEPLAQLIEATERIANNEYYESPKAMINSDDELGKLSRSFGLMMTHLQERDTSLQQLAYYDGVTELHNRHYFEERIEQIASNAIRYGTNCCLIFIDLDDFKIVNDTFGHYVGDQLLKEVSRKLKNTLRSNDVICRLGGDEFAILLENIPKIAVAESLANKIIHAISAPMQIENNQITVGASVGISTCPELAKDAAMLVATADKAMYAAKAQGKNCIFRHSDGGPKQVIG